MDSRLVNPAGAGAGALVSADRLSIAADLMGGMRRSSTFVVDPTTGARLPNQVTLSTPSGKTMTAQSSTTLGGMDARGLPAEVQRTMTMNGRAYRTLADTRLGSTLTTTPAGRVLAQHFEPGVGRPTRTAYPSILPVDYGYDGRGRLTSVTQGTRSLSVSYDASGNVAQVTRPDGARTSYGYDLVGRPTLERRPDGTSVRVAYDADGNAERLIVPSGTTHSFAHTSYGARSSWSAPALGAFRYTYDKDRNLEGVALPSGARLTNTYTHGFLTSTTDPDGTTEYLRGKCGRMNAAIRGSEVASYTYDGWLVTRDTRKGTVNASIDYAYDSDFRPVSITYAGATESLAYDPDGLLVSSGPYAIARDAASGLAETVTATGMSLARTFSGYGELDAASWAGPAGASFSFALTRDAAGRIATKIETTRGGSTVYGYAYDPVGRLVSVTRDGTLAEAYAYDAQGNRTAETRTPSGGPPTFRTLTYDAADRVLTAGDTTYSFDADGFLATKHTPEGTSTYTYSRRGELLSATTPSGTVVTYRYDPMGRRISRSVGGAVTETYLWADATRLLAAYGPAGSLKYRFSYADDRLPYQVRTPTATYTLAFDQVGSLRTVTDSSGAVVKAITYDSFGQALSDTDPALDIPLGFAGGLADPTTGLVRFGARDYDPSLGRFTALDPIDFAGGDTNLYGYCMGDPVNWVDPEGLLYERYDVNLLGPGGLTPTLGVMCSAGGFPYPYWGLGVGQPGIGVYRGSGEPRPGAYWGAEGIGGLLFGGAASGSWDAQRGFNPPEVGLGLPGWTLGHYFVADTNSLPLWLRRMLDKFCSGRSPAMPCAEPQ